MLPWLGFLWEGIGETGQAGLMGGCGLGTGFTASGHLGVIRSQREWPRGCGPEKVGWLGCGLWGGVYI